ncbi:ankyrin repeat-containing domain protein [Chytridium lagenaria]|nr:ankyrin repeat-containing domain protein [Chytridium lagenaria]
MISLNLALTLDGVIGPPHPSTTLRFGIDLPPREETDETSLDTSSNATSETDEPSKDPATWSLWLLLLPKEERAKGFKATTSILWPDFAASLRARLPTLLASPALKRIVDPSNTHRVTHRAVSALLSTASQPSSSAPDSITLLDTAFARFCMTPNPSIDPSSPILDIQRIREVLTGRNPSVASPPDASTTLLHLVSKMTPGTADDVLDLLLDPRCISIDAIHARDGKGWTPLHHAAKTAAQKTTSLNTDDPTKPVIVACTCREGVCVKCPVSRLISAGADVTAATPRTLWTPLHVAAWNGAGDAVGRLVGAGADVWARDAEGWTPLVHAARYNRPGW